MWISWITWAVLGPASKNHGDCSKCRRVRARTQIQTAYLIPHNILNNTKNGEMYWPQTGQLGEGTLCKQTFWQLTQSLVGPAKCRFLIIGHVHESYKFTNRKQPCNTNSNPNNNHNRNDLNLNKKVFRWHKIISNSDRFQRESLSTQ